MSAQIAPGVANLRANVRVFTDLDSWSHAAALEFVNASQSVRSEHRRFVVSFSGGATPGKLYDLLGRAPYGDQIDWAALEAFWGDERCVPPNDAQSNYRQVFDLLLSKVPLPRENIHRICAELGPEEAADAYQRVLKNYAVAPLDWPRFDLALLGLGVDGHTASLFPGSDVDARRPVMPASGHYGARPATRLTLTPPVFNSARQVMFLVSGSEKAGILADVLYGEYRPTALPAQRIRPSEGQSIWLVDRAAAVGLPGHAVARKE